MLSLGGRTLFAAKIKLFQFIGGYPRHKWAPVTYLGWGLSGDMWASTCPLQASSGPLSRLSTPWFNAVCLNNHPNFTWDTEEGGHRLPFIPPLIFLCDGWLSYCVICAFEKRSTEQKKLPASKSYTIKHSYPGTQKLAQRTGKTIQNCPNYRWNVTDMDLRCVYSFKSN